jgi:hypothetical protein
MAVTMTWLLKPEWQGGTAVRWGGAGQLQPLRLSHAQAAAAAAAATTTPSPWTAATLR